MRRVFEKLRGLYQRKVMKRFAWLRFFLVMLALGSVLAVMLHTSRTRAAEYIAAGRVEINHLPLKAAHETSYAEDIFTVRGVGRFRLAAIGGKSKKDRLFISFYQY